jgi:hypothetical protein
LRDRAKCGTTRRLSRGVRVGLLLRIGVQAVDDDVVEQVALADEYVRHAQELSITSFTRIDKLPADLLIELEGPC